MKTFLRHLWDKIFTSSAHLSVVLMVILLLVFLTPMIRRGARAIVFQGTVEFRKLQWYKHSRGDKDRLQAEIEEVEKLRAEIYEPLDRFKRGIDTAGLVDDAKQIYRKFGDELRLKGLEREKYSELRSRCRKVRNILFEAYEARANN